jgi:hypothetical protein
MTKVVERPARAAVTQKNAVATPLSIPWVVSGH